MNGAIVLSQRSRSSAWQMRFKLDNKWIRVTTGKRDRKEAEQAAVDYYAEAKFKLKHSIPLQTRRFKPVAELAIKSMRDALSAGQGKKVYADDITAINGYLIPFFGKHNIDSIDYALLNQFDDWRREKLGRVPRSSTIGTHNSALNRVFDEAINRQFIPASARPEPANKGVSGDRRPDFTAKEYERLKPLLRAWAAKGRAGRTREMRELLYDYVLVLANTGMRPGTETDNLKWKHIRIEKIDGEEQLVLNVSGKTGPRELVARHNCVDYLKRIHKRTEAIKELSFKELLASNSDFPVFCLPDGTATKNLRATFKKFLTDVGMLVDPRTDEERTLYSLRHMYATLALSQTNITTPLLAKQMGTSEAMINKHYSHLLARMGSKVLAGKNHGAYDALDD
jgi:integrase